MSFPQAPHETRQSLRQQPKTTTMSLVGSATSGIRTHGVVIVLIEHKTAVPARGCDFLKWHLQSMLLWSSASQVRMTAAAGQVLGLWRLASDVKAGAIDQLGGSKPILTAHDDNQRPGWIKIT